MATLLPSNRRLQCLLMTQGISSASKTVARIRPLSATELAQRRRVVDSCEARRASGKIVTAVIGCIVADFRRERKRTMEARRHVSESRVHGAGPGRKYEKRTGCVGHAP